MVKKKYVQVPLTVLLFPLYVCVFVEDVEKDSQFAELLKIYTSFVYFMTNANVCAFCTD